MAKFNPNGLHIIELMNLPVSVAEDICHVAGAAYWGDRNVSEIIEERTRRVRVFAKV